MVTAAALWLAAPAGAYIYWIDGVSGGPSSIGRANPDGSSPNQTFLPGLFDPYGMAVDGQYIYWSQFNSSIWRAPLNGTGAPEQYITGLSTPEGLAVDSQNIYWVNSGTNTIGRARLNDPGNPDSTFITVPTGNTIGKGIAVGDGYIYWGNNNSNLLTIGRASLSGPPNPNTNFVSKAGGAWGVALAGGYLYWADGNSIDRALLGNPANPQTGFVTGAIAAGPIAVDDQYVYWANGFGQCQQNCTIGRASLANPSQPDNSFIKNTTLTWGIAVDSGAPVPASTTPPAISGSDQQGQNLTETSALWTNSPFTTVDQWLRCDRGGANCVAIPGATGEDYTLDAADVGSTIRVQEIATNVWGPGRPALSDATAVIASAIPSVIAAPSISGSAVNGQTLTLAHGSWSNGPTGFADTWLRCDAGAVGCAAIPGATGRTYTLAAADLGWRIEVQEVASNAYGSGASAMSLATPPVGQPLPPTAVTLTATALTESSAVLHARVGAGGAAADVHFEFGTTRSLSGGTSTATVILPAGTSPVPVSATVAKLSAATGYYFRIVATDPTSGAVVDGALHRFHTLSRVGSTMTWHFVPNGGYITVTSLVVHQLPAAASIELDCRGGGCPFAKHTQVVSSSKPCHGKHCTAGVHQRMIDVDLTGQLRGAHLATSDLITVRITERGWVGKAFVFHLNSPNTPLIGCLAPGHRRVGKGC